MICLVAGATRGAGRGIATALGAIGATVYCTGRSTRAEPRPEGARPETIEETAELVTAAGGTGIAVRTDHSDESQVAALAARIREEQGRLDVLVNDVWGGDEIAQWMVPITDVDIDKGRAMFDRALFTHVMTSKHMVPLLEASDRALVIEITDGDSLAYRGSLFYDLVKNAVIRLAFATAESLRDKKIAAVALTPGFLRSEAMLDLMEVTEDNWRDGAKKDPHFAFSETPAFVGRAVAALAQEEKILEMSGSVFSSWGLSRRYGFTDANGETPDWGRHAETEDFGADQAASHERFLAGFTRT